MLSSEFKKPKTVKRLKIILAVSVLAFVILSCCVIALAVSKTVKTAVTFDGNTVEVSTFSKDPFEIAEKAGAQLQNGDELVLSAFDVESEKNEIVVQRAHNVTVKNGKSEPIEVRCCGTVADAVERAGIKLKKTDALNCKKGAPLYDGMEIEITHAFKVFVLCDGKTKKLLTAKATVASALKQVGVKLSKNDYTNYEADKAVFAGMKIKVNRVRFEKKQFMTELEFKTESRNDDTLPLGQTQVKVRGEKGIREDCYVYKYVNGKLSEKKLSSSKVTKEPVDEVVLVGTAAASVSTGAPVKSKNVISELNAPFEIELDENGKPKNYKKLIVGEATAYSIDGITATGQKTMPGRIAVNPNQIPYGTKMYIVSSDGKYVYGYAQASDTGGFVRNGRTIADLYFNTENECIAFGRRNVEIYILD